MNLESFFSRAIESSLLPPADLLPSAWIGHVPVMFALVRLLKPRTFVELGVDKGTSFFAACQATAKWETGTTCFAVDNWVGDAHAGLHEDTVFNEFRELLEHKYVGFASYIRDDFDNALNSFDDGTIDLLHIDGFHTYDAVQHDYETWKPKLSRSAVVLFHDINEYREDFGVWRLWAEIKQEFGERAFELHNDHGLGILFFGENSAQLIGGDQSMRMLQESWTSVQLFFSSISHLTKQTWLGRNIELENLNMVLEEIEAVKSKLRATEARQVAMESSVSWKLTRPLRLISWARQRKSQ